MWQGMWLTLLSTGTALAVDGRKSGRVRSSTSGSHETATKRSYARWSTSGTLSRSRAAQARLTRAIRERPPYVSAHKSHRPALELLRATVRGSPDMRGAVHQPTALVCWQVRGARRAPMAQILRHYRGGARHAPPVSPVDETGAAPTTRVRLLSTAQPDHRLHSMRGRRLSGAAVEAAVDGCQVAASGNLVAASRGSRRPPSCYRGAAPVAGRPMPEARTAAGRRASWPQLPGRSARTHCRARRALEPLDQVYKV